MADVNPHVRTDFVHDVFSHIAKRYDMMNSVLSFNQHKSWRKFAMQHMQIQAGDVCLDVATGTGDWAISLAAACAPDGKVVGLDFCQEMLDVAVPKVKRAGVSGRVELVYGNAMGLPFETDQFDCVTIGFGLRNVPDITQVLREMMRVVKPGGMVVSLELSKPTWKPFRSLYYLYFYRILPLIGKIAVGRSEPYRWLPESLIHFPDRFELAKLFEEAGLTSIRHFPLSGGICAFHLGIKPE